MPDAPLSAQSKRPLHYAVADPVRLRAEPVGFDGDRWAVVATDSQGNKLTIVASRERFAEMFRPANPFNGPRSEAEIVRDMFVRDEVTVDVLEHAIDRELRR